MKNYLFQLSDSSVYPGGYNPSLRDHDIEAVFNSPLHDEAALEDPTVTESSSGFKFELSIPGYKREELYVRCDDHVLSVRAIHKEFVAYQQNEHFNQLHYQCVANEIKLPDNVDAEFISAEYRNGKLSIQTPKCKQPNRHEHVAIVVY